MCMLELASAYMHVCKRARLVACVYTRVCTRACMLCMIRGSCNEVCVHVMLCMFCLRVMRVMCVMYVVYVDTEAILVNSGEADKIQA